ncbi:hypothetical protein [Mesoplasma seiffertii]|uniref:hypothetical protein n=1 Tax=Mesoplasma seiffertii TaxID=28224 RepID=UPI00047A2989|nr:hypothetical protein [Mesoplasma seiffertii]
MNSEVYWWLIGIFVFSAAVGHLLIYKISYWFFSIKVDNLIETFGKEFESDTLPILLKDERYRIYLFYYEAVFLDIVVFIMFTAIFYSEDYYYKTYFLMMIISLVLALLVLSYDWYNFSRKVNKEKFFTPQEATNFFDNVLLKKSKVEKYQQFRIRQNDKISVHNHPMQFNQKRYYKKIKKSYQQNFSSYQQYKIFLRYIKDYELFINRIPWKWKVVVLHDGIEKTIDALPKILIDNFVYMLLTTKQNPNNNELDEQFKLKQQPSNAG